MKTKIFLRTYFMASSILFGSSLVIFGQSSEMDSLIYGKNLQILNGTFSTYYSSQCKARATETQLLLKNLGDRYFSKDKDGFNLKIAVLDSSQWVGLSFPYGFFFISQGWIVIPGDLDFQKFSHLWGYYQFRDEVKKNLKKISKDTEPLLTEALYRFVIAHEVGHYYIRNTLNTSSPDRWTNEWTASYFATDFLYQSDKKYLKTYSIFTSTFSKEYNPAYRTLTDFDTIYSDVGLENFVWYHSMFQSMIEDIYSKYKSDFMNSYAKTFTRTQDRKKLSQEELLKKLDTLTGGITSKCINKMESKL